MEDLG
jgi:hypothetical protein